jgi:CarboxypepD_reg-like domain/Secretion system C-terminal sorting domain
MALLKKQVHLAIPTPCTEAWDTMIPDKSGRFCSSCKKNVIDFTRMSDSEILSYFTDFKGSSCGRFTEKQLNKTIVETQLSRPQNHWAWALSALLLPTVAASQTEKKGETIEISVIANETKPIKKARIVENSLDTIKTENDFIKLKGIVIDSIANEPLVGATIVLKGSNIGTLTDIDGHFELTASTKEVIVLGVSFVGYETQELKINSTNRNQDLKIEMQGSVLGEVVVGVLVRRNFFHRTKYFLVNHTKNYIDRSREFMKNLFQKKNKETLSMAHITNTSVDSQNIDLNNNMSNLVEVTIADSQKVDSITNASSKDFLKTELWDKNITAFDISPNPTDNQFIINMQSLKNDFIEINLCNSQGQMVLPIYKGQIESGETMMNTACGSLINGLYLVSLRNSKGQTKYTKLVIQK